MPACSALNQVAEKEVNELEEKRNGRVNEGALGPANPVRTEELYGIVKIKTWRKAPKCAITSYQCSQWQKGQCGDVLMMRLCCAGDVLTIIM